MIKEELLNNLSREDSLDLIQKYVEDNLNQENISNEMFHLFFSVIELGKEVRISLKTNNIENSENKIADIFLTLISICNNLNINLFDAITNKETFTNQREAYLN